MRDIINNPEFRARLYRKVDINVFPNPRTGTPCWIWKGGTARGGYGKIRQPNGQQIYTHRAAFLIEGGTIPTGKQIDHLCRNTRCCNPAHLQAVTQTDNLRRGLTGYKQRHRPRQRKSDQKTLSLPFGD